MNEQLINWIWNYSKLTRSKEILVLLALAQHSNIVGESTVKLAELERMTRLGEDEIRQAIRIAVNVKELGIFPNVTKDGVRLTNTYRFLVFSGPRREELNGEDDIQFGEPPANLPGIAVPKVKDLPQPKIMMNTAQLDMIAADPLYRGLDVRTQALKFKRWARCQSPPAAETVKRFKVWLSRV